VAAAVLLGAFAVHALRGRDPLLDLRHLARPAGAPARAAA
jgi:hypothetical protein